MTGIYVNRTVNRETVESTRRADMRYGDVQQEVRRKQTAAFNKCLSAANDYIENVGKMLFPLRDKRHIRQPIRHRER